MRKLAALLVLLAVSGVTSCAEPAPDAPPPQPAPLAEITVQRFEYPTSDAADTDQNWADLYLPAGPQDVDTIPLVVLIHGGAWQSALGASVFEGLARQLAGRGMAVYNIEYRRVGSGGGWPTTFHDVARALDYIVEVDRQHPQLTTDDELVVGHSAGGQLAVWAGTRHRLRDDEVGSRPQFRPTRVVSLAGPLDMVYAATHGDRHIVKVLGGAPADVPDRYTSVDPIQNIDPSVPVIAMHGTRDTVVAPANSERYVDAVKKQGGRAAVQLLPGDNHTSIVSTHSPNFHQVLRVITTTSQADLDSLLDE
ncbi:prolyl oligopeptidase family serine peptidase [Mycobacterium sp. 21AC1]|uniref:alpha/beta hydrolase family protein n=1 Tax=[Mycobacterium] appelbergii TaxID=2939269 RepID=UPI002938D092|nr:prolyl oligopeptidase family serine peptidase [Mycobacterium sp. 21AC1]MDV3124305.1 prolyl oligopeptidase family serine peptidase [Mycobacterium sp. 21AC1]